MGLQKITIFVILLCSERRQQNFRRFQVDNLVGPGPCYTRLSVAVKSPLLPITDDGD
jgi:hypothetical protein